MDDLELLKDFFLILENCQDPDVVFTELPLEREHANMWLNKLCNDIYRGIDAIRQRNRYLMELSKCIDQRELGRIFMRPPPMDILPPFQDSSNFEIDYQPILYDMQVAAAEGVPMTTPRHYETHMSTKIFDNNRGACAYLAVSLGDPKDGPIWTQMDSSKAFEQNTHTDGETAFGAFCLEAIANELGGNSEPGECRELEEQLRKYEDFIKNYDMTVSTLQGTELRHFLLLNLQTELIQALARCPQRD